MVWYDGKQCTCPFMVAGTLHSSSKLSIVSPRVRYGVAVERHSYITMNAAFFEYFSQQFQRTDNRRKYNQTCKWVSFSHSYGCAKNQPVIQHVKQTPPWS